MRWWCWRRPRIRTSRPPAWRSIATAPPTPWTRCAPSARSWVRPCRLYFITGADAMLETLTWRQPEEIARLCEFIAVARPGYDLDRLAGGAGPALYARVRVLDIPAVEISSTDLRRRAAAGESLRYLVPPPVAEYIGPTGSMPREAAATERWGPRRRSGTREESSHHHSTRLRAGRTSTQLPIRNGVGEAVDATETLSRSTTLLQDAHRLSVVVAHLDRRRALRVRVRRRGGRRLQHGRWRTAAGWVSAACSPRLPSAAPSASAS